MDWKRSNTFSKFSWLVLLYTLAVILWGAYVRATGAGAGCGSHWPLCNGAVIPRPERIETLIEFSHRLSSGLLGILILVQLVWAWRSYAAGHLVRRGAVYSFVFMVTESGIGAGLVLFELVAHNSSAMRAFSGALHLVNTFLLVGALTLTTWWAMGGAGVRLRGQGQAGRMLLLGAVLLLLLGSTGAITALGNTLFPAESLAAGVAQDFAPTSHFLVRLRIWHPVLAVAASLYLLWVARWLGEKRPFFAVQPLSRLLPLLVLLQLTAGVVNVLLLAPIWLQLVHLLLADLLWITFVLLAAAALAQQTDEVVATVAAPALGD